MDKRERKDSYNTLKDPQDGRSQRCGHEVALLPCMWGCGLGVDRASPLSIGLSSTLYHGQLRPARREESVPFCSGWQLPRWADLPEDCWAWECGRRGEALLCDW